jgi:S-DNA-T family DNA segregation ATPase FtsK/SpoIIIE
MKSLLRLFTPTRNRRFNELIGFVLMASALLLFLALVSYTPLDPSLNTASPTGASDSTHNWIGRVGALISDGFLQLFGIAIFSLPVMIAALGLRWFRSRTMNSPVEKALGALVLLMFTPALMAVLPGHLLWLNAIAIEGVLGRILGDFLIHYFNLIGAYLVSLSVIAAALYLCTTFSFSSAHVWIGTHFAFVGAAWQRVEDWRAERKRIKAQQELEKRKAARPTVGSQPAPVTPITKTSPISRLADVYEQSQPIRMGVERVAEAVNVPTVPAESPAAATSSEPEDTAIEVGIRADSTIKRKTVLPKTFGGFQLPPSSMLKRHDDQHAINEEELKGLAQILVEKCAEFDVHGTITHINPGPVVTTYEMKPEAGVKYSRITGLSDDLCLAMKAESILIERMTGKNTVGIQVPNAERETIFLREVVESPYFGDARSRLTLALGKDINGRIITADLATMPHLLIAGSTGSGKSVAINAMIMSLLFKATPEQVRLILVDPKRVELGNYDGVPHLYTPIITEPKLASVALRNAVREMERRLKLLAERGVRNVDQYNKLFTEDTPSLFETETEHKPLPYIVIIIDELADLMMLDGKNVEESITRLAQMARAVGIHLILATQRPSVDVITGLIKANIPTRISFRVATKVDSRTILDANGSESLLGRGDMLFLAPGSARVQRVHAPFVTEKEIAQVVEFWRSQGEAEYEKKFLEALKDDSAGSDGSGEPGEDDHDELFEDAVRLVLEFGKASTSLLQRRLRIGYGRAAHLIDLMERDGIVGAADGPKPREVLKRPDWIDEVEQSLR